jgi:hypothetical protein
MRSLRDEKRQLHATCVTSSLTFIFACVGCVERSGKLGWDDVKRAWANIAAVFAALAALFFFHAALAAVIVACMAVLEWFIERISALLLHGQEVLIYGELKLSYVFQTIDIVLIAGVGVHAIVDAYLIMRHAHQKRS